MPAAAVLGATAVRTAEAGTPATGAAPAAARYDVIVIGAGISGLSAARYLSDRDEDRSEVIPAEVRRAGPARDRRGRNPSCRPAHPDITGAHGKQVQRDVREPLRKTYVIVPVPGGERSGGGRHGGPEPSAAERD